MKRLIALVCMVAVIPVVGILISMYVKHDFENQFEAAVIRQFGEKGAAAIRDGQATLANYCASPDGIDEAVCGTYAQVGLLGSISTVALGVGFALLIGIYLAAKVAATNRRVLLAVFSPGTKVVLVVLFGLIITQGLIATSGAFILESVAVHRVHIVLIAGIGLGALIGAFAMIQAGFSISRRASTAVLGMTASEQAEPALWTFVRDIGERLGANPPGTIVIGVQPTFYVTSADVDVYPSRDSARNETLYLSLPLMRILSREQLAAVVGHELGHFRGQDTEYSIKFYPIYAGTAHALFALYQSAQGSHSIALLPARAVLSFFMDQFARAERTLGRDRELEADKAGASVSSARDLGVALLKVGAFAPLWDEAMSGLVYALQQGQSYPNFSSRFAEHAKACAKPELLADVLEYKAVHPTDTHPVTGVRIEALGLSAEELHDEALTVDPQQSAVRLLSDAVKLEEALTAIQRKALVDAGVTERLRPVAKTESETPPERARTAT